MIRTQTYSRARAFRTSLGLGIVLTPLVAGCASGEPTPSNASPSIAPVGSPKTATGVGDAGARTDGSHDAATQADGAGAAAADADPSIATPNETSGSRLHPIYQRTELADGTIDLSLIGIEDVARGEACSARLLGDGNVHCAPLGESLDLSPTIFFSDASCTSPVIGTSHLTTPTPLDCGRLGTAEGHRYFNTTTGNACGTAALIPFPTTGALAGPFFQQGSSGCVAAVLDPARSYEVFAAPSPLDPIDPSMFVTLTSTQPTLAGPSRLRQAPLVTTGADGFREVANGSIVDTSRQEFCDELTSTDDRLRCMPPAGSFASSLTYFTTSTCSGEHAWIVDNNGPCSNDTRNTFASYMTATTTTASGCANATQIYPIFTGYPLATVFERGEKNCYPDQTAKSAEKYFAAPSLPTQIDPSAFEALTRTTAAATSYGVNGSRIQRSEAHDTTADGFDMPISVTLHDTLLDMDCAPALLNDGDMYCVPNVAPFTYTHLDALFADAACSQSVFGVTSAAPACGGGPPAAGSIYADAQSAILACEASSLYRLPASPLPTSTVLFEIDENGACNTVSPPVANTSFYAVSDCTPIGASDLVAVAKLVSETR
jgi:hypothetical protein